MSSTTRVGFLIPAVTDMADETLYYNNNVTVLENELPSQIASSLPVTGNYPGRIQTVMNNPVGMNPSIRRQNYVYTASGWANFGAFGYKKQVLSQSGVSVSTQQNPPTTSSTEVFASVAMDGISAITLQPYTAYRFHCQLNQPWFGGFSSGNPGPSLGFTGKMNIFIDPTSGTQPTPTTPTAVRLSSPIVESDKNVGNYQVTGEGHYCEFLYAPNVSATVTAGFAAYISATKTDPNWQPIFYNMGPLSGVSGYGGQSVYSMNIKVEALGLAGP